MQVNDKKTDPRREWENMDGPAQLDAIIGSIYTARKTWSRNGWAFAGLVQDRDSVETIAGEAWPLVTDLLGRCDSLGVALYSIILKLLLSIFSVELLDYQGISSSSSLLGIDLLGSLYVIKETFMNCFFDISKGINVYVVLNVIVVAITLSHYIKYIIKNQIYKNYVNIFAVIILGVMLILGAGALAFINSGIDYHNLMLMGYAVFYLFFLILYERGTDTPVSVPVTASDKWYTIKVIPLKADKVGTKVKFVITYLPTWMTAPDMLIINGSDSSVAWTEA